MKDIDAPTHAELIRQAQTAYCWPPLPVEHLEQLDWDLRQALTRLVPIVRQQAARMNHGTTGWYLRDRALGATRNALAHDLEDDPRYAAMTIAELGRRLAELDSYAQQGVNPRSAGSHGV